MTVGTAAYLQLRQEVAEEFGTKRGLERLQKGILFVLTDLVVGVQQQLVGESLLAVGSVESLGRTRCVGTATATAAAASSSREDGCSLDGGGEGRGPVALHVQPAGGASKGAHVDLCGGSHAKRRPELGPQLLELALDLRSEGAVARQGAAKVALRRGQQCD